MKPATQDARPTRVSPAARAGRWPAEHEAGTNLELRGEGRVGAADLAHVPTMELMAELARRERIALRLAIEDALARQGDPRARPPGSCEDDGEHVEARRPRQPG